MGKNFKKFMAILLSVSTVATSGTSSSMLVYASEADGTEVVAETQTTEEPTTETGGNTTEVVVSEDGTTTTEGTEGTEEADSEKSDETTTEEKKEGSTEGSENSTEEGTKKEETEEPEVKTGEVKFQATSKGGKIKVTGKDLLNDNIAYVEGAEPFKAVLELGEVIHVEITTDEGFEVATYKVTMDSGADAVNETEAEGTTYLTKDITVGEEGQLVSVEFKEIPKVEENTENKDANVDVSEGSTEEGADADDSQKVSGVVEENKDAEGTENTENTQDSDEGKKDEENVNSTESKDTQDSEEGKKDEENVDSAESKDTLEGTEDIEDEEPEEIVEGYPECNSYEMSEKKIWVRDTSFDPAKYSNYDNVVVLSSDFDGRDFVADDTFKVVNKVALVDNNDIIGLKK